MLSEVLDNRRVYVITIVTLLVFSGLVLASSSSGVSPVYAKAYRISPPMLVFPKGGIGDSVKVIEPILGQGGSGIIVQWVQTSGFGHFGFQSSMSVTVRANAMSGSLLIPPIGAVVTKGGIDGGATQGDEPLVLSSGVMTQASGQVVSTGLPNGQFFAISGSPSSAQFIQQSQIKPGISINEFGSNSQLSYTGLTTVTSAIPGLWLDSSKRRTRSQIYIEILELMKRGPMTPFEIAFYARLNHKRTKEYAEFLRRSGYLETREEDGKLIYILSKDGLSLLDRVKSLFESQPKDAMPNANYGFTIR